MSSAIASSTDTRARAWLAGLVIVVLVVIVVALFLDQGDDATPALDPGAVDVSPSTDGDVDGAETAIDFATDEPDVAPTAFSFAPTAVFIPAGGVVPSEPAADGGTSTDPADVPAGDPTSGDTSTLFEVDSSESSGAPDAGPVPTAEIPQRTTDPFVGAGDASWYTADYESAGGTVTANDLDFIINNDGTGAIRGILGVERPDGDAITASFDQDFTWEQGQPTARFTLRGNVSIGDQDYGGAPMRIQPSNGSGSVCFSECLSFTFSVPFWAQVAPEG